jgi:hypothetical protein
MKEDHKLIYTAFKLISGSDIESIDFGFRILMMNKDIIKNNHHYYNKLIKHYSLLRTRTGKLNLEAINQKHLEFAIELTGKTNNIWGDRCRRAYWDIICYFKDKSGVTDEANKT